MNTKISLKYKGETIEGILLKEDDSFITVKLDSGYNSILNKNQIEILSKEKINLDNKSNTNTTNQNKKDLLNITILHTGGTIASKVDYKTGAVSSKFTAEELLNLYPDLKEIVNITPKMVGNLFSEDIRFSHYNLLLNQIEVAIKSGSNGIIISHGTDTLGYTASALQYATKNLPIPVILVGAQRSSDRPSSDAYLNLKSAINFIQFNNKLENKFNRVGVCMHKSINDTSFEILDSINIKKLHSTRRDAFKQINYSNVVDFDGNDFKILRDELFTKLNGEFSFTKYNENLKVGFFKAHPNLFPEEISALSIYDAVIIEGTGLGHLGINQIDEETKIHKENFNELKKLSSKIPVIMGVQTVYGQVNLNVYSTGKYLQEIGILGNYINLITETLFLRVAFCLSQKEKSFEDCWNFNLEGFQTRSIEIE